MFGFRSVQGHDARQVTAPGTISLTAPATLVANFTTTTQIVVNRTGGSAGAQTVNYSAAGTCSSAASSVSFADGSSTAQPIVVTTGATTGACTVTLTSVTGTATLGSPTAASITVNAPPPGCPTEPDNLIVAGNFAGMGNALVPGGGPSFSPNTPGTVSGQIIAIPLPAISILSPRSSGVISIGETSTAASPNPVTLHVSISKCRGAISTDTTNQCNLVSGNGNYNAITWFGQPYSIVNGPAPANLRGWCWAPSSEGQWYINARWIHNGCAAGAPTCGFAFQFGFGPY